MFDFLGRWVGRWWWVWVIVWPALAIGLYLGTPPLGSVVKEDQESFLPASADSVTARKLLREGFPGDLTRSTAVIVIVNPEGLTQSDYEYVGTISQWLLNSRERPKEVVGVVSVSTAPFLRGKLDSADGKATLILVKLDTLFTTVPTQSAVEHIQEYLGGAPSHLTIHITGEAGLGRDYGLAVDDSLKHTTMVTAIMVLTILILVYRSPIVPVIPLATVAVSLVVSKALLSLIVVNFQMDILPIAEIILVVVLFGAGTDYCLFLISRYREELYHLQPDDGTRMPPSAYAEGGRRTLVSVGKAVASSSVTDMLGLALMWFADFRGFRTTGPAIALGLGVTLLAALTFAPSLSILLGRLMYGRSVQQQQARLSAGMERTGLWEWVSKIVCRRPGRVLIFVLVALAPLAVLGLSMEPSYDLFSELPGSAQSVKGYQLLNEHFGSGEAFPLTVVLKFDGDFWTPESRAKLRELADVLQQFDLVSEVRLATRPLGHARDLEYLLAESRRLSLLGERFAQLLGIPPRQTGGPPEGEVLKEPVHELTKAQIEKLPVLRGAMGYYISPTGHVAKVDILLREPGYSRDATNFVEMLRRRLPTILMEVGLVNTESHLAGATAVIDDIKTITHRDLQRIMILVVLGVGLVLIPTLKELAAPLYLLATLVLNYLATMGIAVLVFVWFGGYTGLDWKVRFFMFVLLIAVGVDYNIFIMTRIKEEIAKRGVVAGVREAMVRTGWVISSCGVIMAGAFCSMMAGSLAVIVQLGFAVATGILLDTFIVRPIMVPAIVLLWEKGQNNRTDRWPKKG